MTLRNWVAFTIIAINLTNSIYITVDKQEKCEQTASPWIFRKQCLKQYRSRRIPLRFCRQYDYSTYTCIKCYDGYIFNGKNNCVLASTVPQNIIANITSFPSQMYFDPLKIVNTGNKACKTYLPNSIYCQTCDSGFILIQGTCHQDNSYLLSIDQYLTIRKALELCETINISGKCTKCFDGSILNDFKCQFDESVMQLHCSNSDFCYPKHVPCKKYSSQGICKTCPIGTTNLHGRCYIASAMSLCQERANSTYCKECIAEASFNNGRCIYNQPYCQKTNSNGKCISCKPGGRLVDEDCFPISELRFDYQELKCWTWENGRCIQCDYNYKLTSDGMCIK